MTYLADAAACEGECTGGCLGPRVTLGRAVGDAVRRKRRLGGREGAKERVARLHACMVMASTRCRVCGGLKVALARVPSLLSFGGSGRRRIFGAIDCT